MKTIQKFSYRIKRYIKKRKTVKKVNRALGVKLKKWQIDFIFENKPYSMEIATKRCNGKTLAHILRICLKNDIPFNEPLFIRMNRCADSPNIRIYAGEDGDTELRLRYFKYELRNVYEALSATKGIEIRDIRFRKGV